MSRKRSIPSENFTASAALFLKPLYPENPTKNQRGYLSALVVRSCPVSD
jgi:hypothetical protein